MKLKAIRMMCKNDVLKILLMKETEKDDHTEA